MPTPGSWGGAAGVAVIVQPVHAKHPHMNVPKRYHYHDCCTSRRTLKRKAACRPWSNGEAIQVG